MVIDQTGITEKFDFQVEYPPDGADLSDELTAPSIDSVLGKLGLRLERAKDPREFLVIDHVEKPSKTVLENRRGSLSQGRSWRR